MARQTKTRQPARPGAGAKDGGNAAAPAPARKKGFNPFKFFREVRQEGRKVTWTSRQETIVSTVMVLINCCGSLSPARSASRRGYLEDGG